jgi:hypothetical protein
MIAFALVMLCRVCMIIICIMGPQVYMRLLQVKIERIFWQCRKVSKGDIKAGFELCFVLDVSFQQAYIDQIDVVQWN